MRRYLPDTGVAGDFINSRRGVRQRVQEETRRGNRRGICVPVLGEQYFGVEHSKSRDKNLQLLLVALGHLTVWPYTNEASKEYGRVFAELRRTGRLLQQVDVMIAAIALTLGDCTVVTNDSDFTAIPGLRDRELDGPSSVTPSPPRACPPHIRD